MKKYKLDILDYIYIIIGSFIVAVAFQIFLLPNSLVSGGVTGISIVVNSLTGWAPALIQYGLNIPLLIVSYITLGKGVGNKTLLGSVLVPFFLQLVSWVPPATTDTFLAMAFGGLVSGVGLGIVYRAKASTGGTSVPIQLLEEYFNIPLGTSTFVIDGLVIISGMLVFSFETMLYSVITLFITSRLIDITAVGVVNQKTVMIISDEPQKIKQEIFIGLERGVTNLNIRGGYGNTDKEMLMVVCEDREFPFLKDIVLNVDDDAFVVVMSASEVLGRGFSLSKSFYNFEQDHLKE